MNLNYTAKTPAKLLLYEIKIMRVQPNLRCDNNDIFGRNNRIYRTKKRKVRF